MYRENFCFSLSFLRHNNGKYYDKNSEQSQEAGRKNGNLIIAPF